MNFSEDFLHYLWKFRLFDSHQLTTVSGETLSILSNGLHNKNAGPDFEEAMIRINGTLWAGNVEIHINSSDWDKHFHTTDQAYANVILHVVYNHDKLVFRNDGTEIQTLELKSRVPRHLELKYEALMQNLNWIPCEKSIIELEPLYITNWLSRVLIERLEEKSTLVKEILIQYRGSWDDVFYILLARNFGFKINALPFELLARSLPQKILAWHRKNSLQVEALIFGQAGFLSGKSDDEYIILLQKEYNYLNRKYFLQPLDKFIWKFLRMRPQNFPTLRLAQFAALVLKSSHLFSRILEKKNRKTLTAMFTNLPVNPYWEKHFRFEKEANVVSVQPGEDTVNNILLNTVSIVLYAYGKETGDGRYMSRALTLLESLPPEINQVTSRFNEIGVKNCHADTSQALLQLKKCYCDTKKCLYCGIGTKLLKQS